MGPVKDDDEMGTRSAGEVPVKSESPTEAGAVADRGDDDLGVEERLLEEAGYGYGV